MKNNDNDRLLAHKQAVDNERRAQAILRARRLRQVNSDRMARVMRAATQPPEGEAS